jgi:hypothetical protein
LRPLPVPVSNAQIQQQSRESGETTESLGDPENTEREATADPAVFGQRFRGQPFKNVTLEMSLKPFKKNEPDNIRVHLNAGYPWFQGRIAFEPGPADSGPCRACSVEPLILH